MSSRASLIELATLATKYAVKEGATEAEAFGVNTRGYVVSIFAGQIKELQSINDVGIGIRVAVGKRLGFAYATGTDFSLVKEAARRAVKLARVSSEDIYWRGLPEPSPVYPEPGNIYDSHLAYMSPETLVENAVALIDYVSQYKDKGVILSRAGLGVHTVERAITNTNGVYRIDVGTHAHVVVSTIIRKDGDVTPAVFKFDSSRITFPSIERTAERAIEVNMLCTRKIKGLEPRGYTVVYVSEALAELLSTTVLASLNGEMVVRGRSYYAGRLEQRVMDERITIIDDGTLKGGDNTWRFDGEGVAMQKKALIEKGVLKGFIFDNYWGQRAGKTSTGNAVRGGYASTPSPGFTNVVILEGDASPEELLDGRVIVVYNVQGAHTANRETGEYSVLANPAILYENGEARGWIQGATLGGNLYTELESKVELVGRLVEKPYPGIYVPWIRIREIRVAQQA